ncbi:hypothetical protein B4Q13_21935, partial [Lacticaseibacillus rhamnosus]
MHRDGDPDRRRDRDVQRRRAAGHAAVVAAPADQRGRGIGEHDVRSGPQLLEQLHDDHLSALAEF